LRFIGKKFKFDTFPSIFCLLKTSKQNENWKPDQFFKLLR
jgi:hypothetical protein